MPRVSDEWLCSKIEPGATFFVTLSWKHAVSTCLATAGPRRNDLCVCVRACIRARACQMDKPNARYSRRYMLFAADNGRNARYARASSSIPRALESVRCPACQQDGGGSASARTRRLAARCNANPAVTSQLTQWRGRQLWGHFLLSNARALIAMRHLDDLCAQRAFVVGNSSARNQCLRQPKK